MTPILNPAELAVAQEKCAAAFDAAWKTDGMIERLKLFHTAFPFSVTFGPAEGYFHIGWNEKHKIFSIADSSGFLTLLDLNLPSDLAFFQAALKAEARTAGTLRERLTGQKSPPRRQQPPSEPKRQITLADLGL